MFQRIRDYHLIHRSGRSYRPRAYGDSQLDGTWDGWLIFFPVGGGPAIASDRETTQSTIEALMNWAAALTAVYLDGALARALDLAQQPSVINQLKDAEYEALEGAERLEAAARIERIAAEVDETAAATARSDAEWIRQDRLATEDALAAAEAAVATTQAELHTEAARQARAIAADATRRRRKPRAGTTRVRSSKGRSDKKKK